MTISEELREHLRELGRLGGKRRAEKLTPERMKEISRLGVLARKEKKPPNNSP